MSGPRGPHAVVLYNRRGEFVAVVAVRASEAKARRWLKSKGCKDLPLSHSYEVQPVGYPEKLMKHMIAKPCLHRCLDDTGACCMCGNYVSSTD